MSGPRFTIESENIYVEHFHTPELVLLASAEALKIAQTSSGELVAALTSLQGMDEQLDYFDQAIVTLTAIRAAGGDEPAAHRQAAKAIGHIIDVAEVCPERVFSDRGTANELRIAALLSLTPRL